MISVAGVKEEEVVINYMRYPINYKEIKPKLKYYSEVVNVYNEAEKYLLSFDWCTNVKQSALYTNLGEKFCIFLFEIDNSASDEDSFLWVVAGDIPAMYLDIYGSKTTKEVVEGYVELAEDWINHIRLNKSVDECYPFNANPTLEIAELLERRTSFMKDTLIKNIEDIPISIPI